jgi:hypothetical protein
MEKEITSHPKSLPNKGGIYFPFPLWGKGQGVGVRNINSIQHLIINLV